VKECIANTTWVESFESPTLSTACLLSLTHCLNSTIHAYLPIFVVHFFMRFICRIHLYRGRMSVLYVLFLCLKLCPCFLPNYYNSLSFYIFWALSLCVLELFILPPTDNIWAMMTVWRIRGKSIRMVTLPPVRGAKYSDQHVCLCVSLYAYLCLSAHIFQKPVKPHIQNHEIVYTCFLWLWLGPYMTTMLCACSFVDDIMFSYNVAYTDN